MKDINNPQPKKEFCIYDGKTKAVKFCATCEAPLCSGCGYLIAGEPYCNDCYEKYDEQETGICKSCGEELEPIMENNGFTMPEGPEHWEVSGYKLCECRKEQDNE